jgi:hypothetical protein
VIWATAQRRGGSGRGSGSRGRSHRSDGLLDVVDRRRFRVSPQKGDIPYLPLHAAARRTAKLRDPAKDEAGGNACLAHGAVGVIERPRRLDISWESDTTLPIDAAGTPNPVARLRSRA